VVVVVVGVGVGVDGGEAGAGVGEIWNGEFPPMKLEIGIQTLDAQLHIPEREYDNEGNDIGPNRDWEKMFEEAKGKSFIRIMGIDFSNPDKPQQIAFESANGTDIAQMIQECFRALGRAVARRYTTQHG